MDLQTAIGILKRRAWTIAFVAMIGVVIAALLFYVTPRQYQASSQVMVVRSGAALDATAVDMQALAASTNVVAAVKKDIHSPDSIDQLKGKISSKVTFGSSIIPLEFMDTNPRQAVAGANAVAVELANYYRQIANSRLSVVSGFMQKQLDAKRAELLAVDRTLQRAAIKNPYNSAPDPAATIAQQILTLDQQRDALQATLVGDQAQAGAQARHMAEISSIVLQEKTASDPLYQKMRSQEAQDAAQLSLLRSQFKKYPGTPGLETQVQQEQQQLAAEQQSVLASPTSGSPTYTAALAQKGTLDATLAADNARLSALNQQIGQTEDSLAAVPGMGVRVADLRRQRDIIQAEYMSLAQRFGDVVGTQAQGANVGSIDVIDRARTASGTIAKHSMMAILGSVLGFAILGLALAFLLEMFDNRVRTVAAVEGLYGRPVLGTVTPD